jgi:hypothetical protein
MPPVYNKRGRRRRDEVNIGGKKLFIVGHPHAQLTAEGGCRRTAGMRSADRNRVRRPSKASVF